MGAPYLVRHDQSCRQKYHITIEHHYQVEVFSVIVDSRLQELNSKFNDHSMELLTLSSVLSPKDSLKSFCPNKICKLASKFNPDDFSEHEKISWHLS